MSQVWCADDTFFGDLIYLSDERLVVDHPKKDDTPNLRDALLQGQTPAAVLSSDAVSIPLSSVTKIETDAHNDEIDIHYFSGKEIKEETLHLADSDKRAEVYAALKRAYSGRFTEAEDQWSLARAIYMPLLSLSIVGFLTWIFSLAAAELANGADSGLEEDREFLQQAVAWILTVLGPVGVWIIGGIVCALIGVLLVQRAKNPPLMHILQEKPYRSQSIVVTIFKYLILFAIWAYLIRVAWVWNQ